MPVDEQAFAQLQKRLEVVEAKLALRQILVGISLSFTPVEFNDYILLW